MLEADIKAAVEKNLPAEVGRVLQDRLKLADGMEKTIADLNGKVNTLREQVKEYDNRVLEFNARGKKLDEREASATKRETDVAAREDSVLRRELAQNLSDFKVDAANQGTDILGSLFPTKDMPSTTW